MHCYGGPLDGLDCDPGMIGGGFAVLGLVRRKVGHYFSFWDAEVASHRHALHAVYVVLNGKLIYKETRC